MTSAGIKKSYQQGLRLTEEIRHHRIASGGITCGIWGSKGSGKTTFLLTLSQVLTCQSPDNKDAVERETVVWRGRPADYWTWLPQNMVHIFIHRDDYDKALFKNDLLEEIPRASLPPIEKYSSIRNLYAQLRKGKINVVYEPMNYTITDNIKKMIQRRGVMGDELFKSVEVDPIIFWFEFMNWLLYNKNQHYLSLIFDEADELFPTSPSGARWHLNLWAKDVIKDLRRRRLSLIMACHGYQDLDGRIISKIQYKIYMKGSVTPSTSIVNRRAPIMLEPGTYYIERDGWGLHGFNKIEERSIVLTYLKGEDIDAGFEGDEDKPMSPPPDSDEGILPPAGKRQPGKPAKPKGGSGELKGGGINLPAECLSFDGDMPVVDLTKIKGVKFISGTPMGARPKKVKPKSKEHVIERKTDKDDVREHARAYDEKVKAGEVVEPDKPKPIERNDNTTDEVDK